MVLRAENASDVAVDDVVLAQDHNTLRADTLNALGGFDFATQETLLLSSPATGDVAYANDTGALYVCLAGGTWTLWIDPPGQAPATNYWDGLKLTVANIDDITMGRGTARNIQDTASINQPSTSFIKKLDREWEAGSGGGMRDSNFSLAAKRWFNLYMLGQSTDPEAVDLFASGVATDSELISSLPVGWDNYAFVGAVYWDGGGIRDFIHRGKEFRWKEPQLDVDAKIDGNADVFETVALSIPATARTLVRLIVSTSGGADGAVIRTPGTSDAGFTHASVIAGRNTYVEVLTDANGRIEYTMTGTTWGEISIATIGWDDERGSTMIIPPPPTLAFLGTVALTAAFTLSPGAVMPDDSHVVAVDDNVASGGDVEIYAMTDGVPGGSNLNTAGNHNKLRGASVAGMWMKPDGTYCALFGRDKSTQQWHFVTVPLDDVTDTSGGGNINISADPDFNVPPSTQVEAIWDETRGRLWIPGSGVLSADVAIFNVASPGSPTFVGKHTIAGASSRSFRAFRWSENKAVVYAAGAEQQLNILTPSGSGDSFTENIVDTGASTWATLAHDGTTLIVVRRDTSNLTTIQFAIYSINPADETDLTLLSSESVDTLGLITGSELGGFMNYATFRNDVLGLWCRNTSTTKPAQYVTFDFTDLDNPLFLEELIDGVDPDVSHICSSSGHMDFDGLHTQMLIGNIPDDGPQTSTFSVVGYA